MFFNREDIAYFKPCKLRTKMGRIGHIKEPLGTHGHMKCVFDGQLKSQDTVLLHLYKRVFPKWTYEVFTVNCGNNESMEIDNSKRPVIGDHKKGLPGNNSGSFGISQLPTNGTSSLARPIVVEACGCRKAGLKCSMICGVCNGKTCENATQLTLDKSDEDDLDFPLDICLSTEEGQFTRIKRNRYLIPK
ncbi:hypothetical protein NQ318_016492 [Aromia moschata]|uniref:Pre-rRNA-processing protein TSR1 homolog n=1 Tax=Aromia moschata TaxID=1265417 RepID=A0AAV8X573_9CUCU|nr:hypothetical protein NQ318_016492 [Aromia moschata]